MSFNRHPSRELQSLFEAKPYQGADPSRARFVFFGLDANFAERIDERSCFTDVCEYLQDGAAFWRKHRVHHPFLLEHYCGDGRLYHVRFSNIAFAVEQADDVSFVELIDVPTFGGSKLRVDDLLDAHLDRLLQWVTNGRAQHVFMPPGVVRILRKVSRFSWLFEGPTRPALGLIPIVYSSERLTVYSPFHFSCVGRYCPRTAIDQQLAQIRELARAK